MAAHIDATVAEAIKQQRLAASSEAIVSEAQLEALQIRLDALHSAQLLEVRCGERRNDFPCFGYLYPESVVANHRFFCRNTPKQAPCYAGR